MNIKRPFFRRSATEDTTRRYWGDAAKGKRVSDYPVHWLQSDLVLELCVNPRISGDPKTGWLEWVRQEIAPEPLGKGLVLNEFTGPDCFQWTDRQLKLATCAIRSLPLRLRRNRDFPRWKRYLKPWTFRAKRWSPEKLKSIDPSEAVRSSEIPSLVAGYFEILALKPYGGTILSLALNNIVGNFTEDPRDLNILKRLVQEETFQMEDLGLPSDYHLIVGKKGF